MRQAVNAAQMKYLDDNTMEHHRIGQMVLMERAALAVVEEMRSFDLTRVLVICGSGNNGGDGIAIARILHLKGVPVDLFFVGNPEKKSTGCTDQWAIADSYGTRWINNPNYSEYTTIVDALFGVGLSRPVVDNYAEVIHSVNVSGVPVVAVDIPSGICADTGNVLGCAIKADLTVTFAFEKVGQLLPMGKQHCGRLILKDIGIYQSRKDMVEKQSTSYHIIEASDLKRIPVRSEYGNKGTFGKVLLIAGSKEMPGASVLCGQAVLRTGSGMLKIVAPVENRQIIASTLPEAMIAGYTTEDEAVVQIKKGLSWADVVVVGPGIGTGTNAAAMVQYVMEYCRLPLVLDADGLNIISQNMDWLKKKLCPCILTPHMGELARLLGQSVSKVKEDFFEKVQSFANEYEIQCICKDSVTCTVMPNGSIFINQTGNCGMATAGSGDVLTGIIGGLLSVGTLIQDAGVLGVYIHGMAGDLAKEKYGSAHMVAGDLIKELAQFRIGEEGGLGR